MEAALNMSSLSTEDFLMLNTTFDVFADPKTNMDCDKNILRFDRLPDREVRVAEYRRQRGCGGLPSHQTYRIYPYILKTCPCFFQNRARFSYIWTLFDSFDRLGIAPFSGSLANQPAWIIEAFDVLRGLKAKHEQKRNKQHGK
jgi:hypothetical protein